MWAAAAIAVVGVLGALAQHYNAKKAQGAAKKELDQLRDEFDRIKPPNYDVSITDPPEYIQEQLKEPQYDFSSWTPEQYEVVQKYAPQVAPFIAESSPQLVQYSQQGETGIKAQQDALRDYIEMAKGDRMSPSLMAKLDLASRRGQADAQSRQASLLQDFARRGQMGSGLQLAAQMQGGEAAMERAADDSRMAAIEAERERLQALAASGEMGRSLAQQDLSLQDRNAQIMNDFNQRTSKNYQDWLYNQQNTLNNAQLKNLAAAQTTADKNVDLQNDAFKYNQDQWNSGQEKLYGYRKDERDRLDQIAEAKANWAQGQKAYGNTLKSQQYADQMKKADSKAGIASNYMTLGNQAAMANANAIQGVTEGAMTGISAYGNAQDRNADRELREKELRMKYGKNTADAYQPNDEYEEWLRRKRQTENIA